MTALGVVTPRVAILSAVETVSPDIRSTIDAAALCKMADRGQITGGMLDGPLAFDNAVSLEAARTKGIVSPVAGQADILVVPDLEAGNMLAKQLVYLADAEMAGIVLGARVPIILTSRADNTIARLGSAAIALILVRSRLARRPLSKILNATKNRARRNQRHAEPVGGRELLAQKQHAEDRHQHDAELVDRRDPRRVAELQRAEVAEPGAAGREPRQDEKDVASRRHRA